MSTYRELQEENNKNFQKDNTKISDIIKAGPIGSIKPRRSTNLTSYAREIGYGESRYDKPGFFYRPDGDINEMRAQSQGTLSSLTNGLIKSVGIAGTTILDGWLSIPVGIIEPITNGTFTDGDPSNDAKYLYTNSFSEALDSFNKKMEEWFPNYYTRKEASREWYQNLGSIDFWADSIIKNMGFAVGAAISGAGAVKALKALKLVKGSIGAQHVGSLYSAFAEGRIEGRNAANDFEQAELLKLNQVRDLAINEANKIQDPVAREQAIAEIDDNFNREAQNAIKKAQSVGVSTLLANTAFLYGNNLITLGKLYGQGFKNARVIANGNKINKDIFRQGLRQASRESNTLGKRIIKEGDKYAIKSPSYFKTIIGTSKNGLLEGNEEMIQALISETTSNYYGDTPDSYYRALTDPQYNRTARDFIGALAKGFGDTYGNISRYEEAAAGFLTGLLGIPTFGRANNSSNYTYMGKNKPVALSGGILGDISQERANRTEAEDLVSTMNRYLDDFLTKKGHFVQNQVFTNDMNGWAEENNAFEYKNSEDNSDFSAISAYSRAGKLDDFIELINQDFENMSDKDLDEIAKTTTPATNSPYSGGWKNPDGSYMSDTQEGRDIMRKELSKKRDKLIKEVRQYEDAVQSIKGITSGLGDSQIEELAWLYWKVKRFEDRFKEVKEETSPIIRSLISNTELNEKEKETLNKILESNNSLELFNKLNIEDLDVLTDIRRYSGLENKSNLDYNTYLNTLNSLEDLVKLSTSAHTFNSKYKEYVEDPIKLMKNREKIDKEQVKEDKKISVKEKAEELKNKSVSDIVKDVKSGKSTLAEATSEQYDEVDDMMTRLEDQGDPNLPNDDFIKETDTKVDEAKKIINVSKGIKDNILAKYKDFKDNLPVKMALRMVDRASESIESLEDLRNIDLDAYNTIPFSDEEYNDFIKNNPNTAEKEIEILLGQTKTIIKDAIDESIRLERETPNVSKEDVKNAKKQSRAKKSKDPKEVGIKDKTNPGEAVNTIDYYSIIDDAVNNVSTKLSLDKKSSVALKRLFNSVLTAFKKTKSGKDLKAIILKRQSYNILKDIIPNIDSIINSLVYSFKTNTKFKYPVNKVESSYVPTPSITEQDITNYTTEDENTSYEESQTEKYSTWKTTTSEVLIYGRQRGDFRPTYEALKDLKKSDGSPMYTEDQLRKIELLYKFLESKGAFKFRDTNNLKRNEKLFFTTYKELNDRLGETAIFLTTANGQVVGDLGLKSFSTTANQEGLIEFIEQFEKEYRDNGSPSIFTLKDKSVKVSKVYIGKVPYIDSFNSLNEVGEVTSSDGSSKISFTIGIAVESGRSSQIITQPNKLKSDELTEQERSILYPRNAVAGQPYILLETGHPVNKYTVVPFITPKYSSEIDSTRLGKQIERVLNRFKSINEDNLLDIKSELQELFAAPDLHINIKDGKLNITYKSGDTYRTIYKGDINNPNLVDELKRGFNGFTIQISRKYINSTYNGESYNELIGEIAKINLPKGTHSVINTFIGTNYIKEGKETKATNMAYKKKPSTPVNNTLIEFEHKGNKYYINTSSYAITDSNGKVYTGADSELIKARFYGVQKGFDLNRPYLTEWGMFNYKENKFITKPTMPKDALPLEVLGETPQTPTEEDIKGSKLVGSFGKDLIKPKETSQSTNIDLDKKASQYKLLKTPQDKAIWNILTDKQKESLLEFSIPKAKKLFTTIVASYNVRNKEFNPSILKADNVDELLSNNKDAKYRVAKEYTDEMIEILNEAPRDSQGRLLAPNGKPSNLTERQYAQVRTKAFKEWFGDWEKVAPSTESAKKLVSYITDISNRNNRFSKLAQLLLDNKALPYNLKYFKIDNNRDDIEGGAGMWHSLVNYIEVLGNNVSQESIDKRLLHELIHYNTEQILQDYKDGKITDDTKKEAIKNLYDIITYAKDFLSKDLQINRSKYLEIAKRQSSIVDSRLFYAFDNKGSAEIDEFISEIFTNPGFQEVLNNIPYKESKQTIWDKIKDAICSILGFNINKGSVLEEALKASSNLLQNNNNVSKVVDENGEPLVVYHYSTNDNLIIFDRNFPNYYSTKDGQENAKNAFFFTSNPKPKKGTVLDRNYRYEIFLNIRDLIERVGTKEELRSKGIGFTKTINETANKNTKYSGIVFRNIDDNQEVNQTIWVVTDENQIKSATDNTGAFSPKDDDIRYKVKDTPSYKPINLRRELRWLNKAIPNLQLNDRVRLVESLERITDNGDAEVVWGQVKNGIMTINTNAASGTVYHEAFHIVTDSFLSNEERDTMFNEARAIWGNKDDLSLEENLAEAFREYVELEDIPFVGNIVKLFRSLKHIIRSFIGNEPYLDNLFYRINRGKYKNYTISTTNNSAKYRISDLSKYTEKQKILINDVQRFLDNFSIDINEVKEFNSEEPLFNALERTINIRNVDDITEGVGYAIAFMMQHNPIIDEIIAISKYDSPLAMKGLRRGIKKGSITSFPIYKGKVGNSTLKFIGNEISLELKRFYGLGESNNKSLSEKIHESISEYYKLFNRSTRDLFDTTLGRIKEIVHSIKLNDTSYILNSLYKPKTDVLPNLINVEKALKDNPYEDSIIKVLNKYNISLAGGASIALAGSLYRPKENPLHDIDFNAVGYTREEIDRILDKEFKYVKHYNTIDSKPTKDKITESYIILDRDFIVERDLDNMSVYILKDANTKEVLGTRIENELFLKEGVNGKILDFFIGSENRPYPNYIKIINNTKYLIADYRNAMDAKVDWAREKDIWDYNRFNTEDDLMLKELNRLKYNEEFLNKFRESTVIWGHPALGKTEFLKNNKDILEWDEEVNSKRFNFIRDQIDPKHILDTNSKEYLDLLNKYLSEWRSHPEYIEFLTKEWDNLVKRAKAENKKLLASPIPLIEIGAKDIDMFIVLNHREFITRNTSRGGKALSSERWKQVINEYLSLVNYDKIFYTSDYLSEIMIKAYDNIDYSNSLKSYYIDKYSYDNISPELKSYLDKRGISEETYNRMTLFEKEVLIKCMI